MAMLGSQYATVLFLPVWFHRLNKASIGGV